MRIEGYDKLNETVKPRLIETIQSLLPLQI